MIRRRQERWAEGSRQHPSATAASLPLVSPPLRHRVSLVGRDIVTFPLPGMTDPLTPSRMFCHHPGTCTSGWRGHTALLKIRSCSYFSGRAPAKERPLLAPHQSTHRESTFPVLSFLKYVFIWLCQDLASEIFNSGMLTLWYGMWDLVPWPGVKPQPPALGAWSLSHWTTREVPHLCVFKLTSEEGSQHVSFPIPGLSVIPPTGHC